MVAILSTRLVPYAILIASITAPSLSFAQQAFHSLIDSSTSASHPVTVLGELGVGVLDITWGGKGSLVFLHDWQVVDVIYAASAHDDDNRSNSGFSFTTGTDVATPKEWTTQTGILLGACLNKKKFFGSLSAGPVYIWGLFRGNLDSSVTTGGSGWSGGNTVRYYESVPANVFGLTVQLRTLYKASDYIALGFSGLATINSKRNYGGVLLSLMFGEFE